MKIEKDRRKKLNFIKSISMEGYNRDSLADQFMNCVRIHVSKEDMLLDARFVHFYAHELDVHPNHLNAVVKKKTGRPALSFIHQQLIIEAKLMLIQSTLSVKQIAYKLTFRKPEHFNTFFRKHTKLPPKLYRQSKLQ